MRSSVVVLEEVREKAKGKDRLRSRGHFAKRHCSTTWPRHRLKESRSLKTLQTVEWLIFTAMCSKSFLYYKCKRVPPPSPHPWTKTPYESQIGTVVRLSYMCCRKGHDWHKRCMINKKGARLTQKGRIDTKGARLTQNVQDWHKKSKIDKKRERLTKKM